MLQNRSDITVMVDWAENTKLFACSKEFKVTQPVFFYSLLALTMLLLFLSLCTGFQFQNNGTTNTPVSACTCILNASALCLLRRGVDKYYVFLLLLLFLLLLFLLLLVLFLLLYVFVVFVIAILPVLITPVLVGFYSVFLFVCLFVFCFLFFVFLFRFCSTCRSCCYCSSCCSCCYCSSCCSYCFCSCFL